MAVSKKPSWWWQSQFIVDRIEGDHAVGELRVNGEYGDTTGRGAYQEMEFAIPVRLFPRPKPKEGQVYLSQYYEGTDLYFARRDRWKRSISTERRYAKELQDELRGLRRENY